MLKRRSQNVREPEQVGRGECDGHRLAESELPAGPLSLNLPTVPRSVMVVPL